MPRRPEMSLPGLRRGWPRRHRGRVGTGASPERLVQVVLGLVWLVDGVLQCQPSMFQKGFVTGLLVPTAAGNPTPVATSILGVAHFIEPHVAVWNALFAATQLAIGAGLLVRRTVRPALAFSLVWSLLVWWFGEGLGGLLSGSASPLTGAPGAVLWYVLAALLAWPRGAGSHRSRASVARGSDEGAPLGTVSVAGTGGLLGATGARLAWAVLWVGSALLLCQPGNLAGGGLRQALTSAEVGQPHWYAQLLSGAAAAVGSHGSVLTLAVAGELALVGIGVALGWRTTALLGVASFLALVIWVLPEGLGGILTGRGTDPNSGPLLALAALAWYRSQVAQRQTVVLDRVTLAGTA